MASDPFTIWTDEVLTPPVDPAPEAGVPYDLGVTPTQENSPTHRDSITVNIDYKAFVPNVEDGLPPFRIGAVLEALNAQGEWVAIGYQFSNICRGSQPPLRSIRVQPDMSDFNAGVDDSVYPVDREIARISRQQGFLPDNGWRVRIICTDQDPQGANGLQSVKVSISGERYDHAG